MPERQPSATADQLFARLDEWNIAHKTFEHDPVFTVEESQAACGHIPGGHTKNLFLKDRKEGLWLVVAQEDLRVDLKALSDLLNAPRFSFGSGELLIETLGVPPGSVTPFSIINDGAGKVRVVLDAEMLKQNPVNFHPLRNDRTTAIAPDDLVRFLEACDHAPMIVHLPERS
ncbi:MAG TPA: prolyl-tRNA synthetase associated domain-containing protein [Rhizomicrobium sp.]|jgi:Ala-tRNA(Pro) deacylase|nr:prolyl-tRNA synthetase associated domain-containing protein [Rhizomicrobium sp.]